MSEIVPVPIGELAIQYPGMKPAVVDGLIRQGETAGIHAKSKVGKSWLAYSLALSVAGGYWWLGKFRCERGKVLLLDAELHPEVLASRIPAVARAMNIPSQNYEDRLHVVSMRGRLRSITAMADFFKHLPRGEYSMILIDALYRFIPGDVSESDNAAMTQVFNAIDAYAASTGAAFVFIHHQSKGDQSGKDLVDVGSGAGSIARAVDAHIALRAHEEEQHVVLDAALRSFPPLDSPIVLRWEFPLWRPQEHLNPEALKRPKAFGDARQEHKDREAKDAILDALDRAGTDQNRKQLRAATGMGFDRINRILASLLRDGEVEITHTTEAKNHEQVEWFRRRV